ncbi:IgGFc-binding protein-like [Betta splendens]|uniref:IgGFc-binding protein-like n=1 Tax=Betta splendens TaxID=158456 RepID=A0A6P7NV79_BETSP|nr:IgGFc-binding protein-like [Betta splendens]XP_055368970.1 IgGFc-binding protein-like [Betta splendens]
MDGLLHCLLSLLLIGLCSASPAGREFATSFMQNLGSDGSDTRFVVEVAALPSSRGTTKVKVTAVGQTYEKEISPGKSESFKLPNSVEMKSSQKSKQAVLIETSQDVTVMSLNYKQYTADTSVVYPVNDWGTEYFIFTPSSFMKDTFKEFSITNYKEANTVEILLQGSVRFQGKHYRRGSKMTLKLEPLETAQIQSQDDLSGTKVTSRLPVAVSSGHSCAQKYTSCNHVYEQLLPASSWGKEFVIAPLPYHSIISSLHDSVFVQASQPTKITLSVDGKVQTYPMFAGQTLELYSQWPYAMYLTSDKGVQVLFEFNGGPDDVLEYFDPFLMTILPTSYFSTSYSLEGQGEFYNNVIIVARNKDLNGITIDPQPQSATFTWQNVTGTDFSWTEMYYSTGANFYKISHPESPFGLYSYGVSYANGYGSPASADTAVKHDCSTTKCPKGEVCRMEGTAPTCVKAPPQRKAGTCWAMGDPHYRTFDGSHFNFMGNCTYTMVKNCNVIADAPAFEVEAQNYKDTGSQSTAVGKVVVRAYGHTITIVRSEFGLVRMNHTLWNLPVALGDGAVKLSQSGLSVMVETDFGLTLQYDWKEYLVITVPGSFSGRLCGLCGNFNDRKEDDLATPTGAQAGSAVALGKSWRVAGAPGDAQCRDECPGNCDTCDRDGFFDGLKDRIFCGLLTRVMNGPLSDCNAVVDSKVFHQMCMYDVCMGEGMKDFLCNTLQVYADACQRAGIKIYDWRHLARCSPPSCTANSHYEFCGNACPATCENPDAASKCNKSCVETCVCDEGFLLSGTECVPKAQCGCSYNGAYIEAGASFFTGQCAERCTCNRSTKSVDCVKPGCQQGYQCKVVNGLIGCHPLEYAECSMTGDGPHINTFDGYNYNFHGTCVYQLAGVCSKTTPLPTFQVDVQNDVYGTGAKLVEVKVDGDSIVVTRTQRGTVLINGEFTNLPIKLKGNITVQQISDSVEIQTDFGLLVSYDRRSAVHVKVPSAYAEALCGLCGSSNHTPEEASGEELAKRWRVAEIPGCVDGCKNKSDCPSCDITQKNAYETDEYCGLIQKPTGPFHACHAVKNPRGVFDNCVYDACLHNGRRDSWCGYLHSYTVECQRRGINVSQWRTEDFCPPSKMTHPSNSHYEHCGDVCQAACDTGLPPVDCERPCEEGWLCNDGFLLSGSSCEPLHECGCEHEGKYYRKGESFLSADCRQSCVCNSTVQCRPHSCGPFETCALHRHVRSCQPMGTATCTISGDPHYRNFNNQSYDFQGTCTYTAARSCHLDGSQLEAFSVAVENEKWTMTDVPNVAVAKLVAVEVYGYTLILRSNQLKTIMVNGALTTIPLSINEGKVEVYQEGFHYAIVTDFGLKVTYDMIYKVTVTVSAKYMGKTCGLCGNYNVEADGFELPDGRLTHDTKSFGAAWKVAVPGVVCDDGCEGDLCPKCDGERRKACEQDCGRIRDPNGSFAACHSSLSPESYYNDCVYDTCMSHGDRRVLCLSIAAYVSDCQAIGVNISSWRTPDFCPIQCSDNSQYHLCAEACAYPCPGLVDTITCPTTCMEGCTCVDGFYFNGTGCVALEHCGCYYNGRTFKIGESVLSDNCQQLCNCTTSGVQCEDVSCSLKDRCQLQHGVYGCYPRECVLETGGSITLFSGLSGDISVMGAYEIMANCDESASDWFRIVAMLQQCSLTGVKSVVSVYIFFNDLIVTLTNKQETWVNGKKVTLPNSPGKNIFVRLNEKTIIVEMTSVFQLHYSSTQEVTVTVGDSMVDQVCGACDKMIPFTDMIDFPQDAMQEYMASFSAPDFPSCEL